MYHCPSDYGIGADDSGIWSLTASTKNDDITRCRGRRKPQRTALSHRFVSRQCGPHAMDSRHGISWSLRPDQGCRKDGADHFTRSSAKTARQPRRLGRYAARMGSKASPTARARHCSPPSRPIATAAAARSGRTRSARSSWRRTMAQPRVFRRLFECEAPGATWGLQINRPLALLDACARAAGSATTGAA